MPNPMLRRSDCGCSTVRQPTARVIRAPARRVVRAAPRVVHDYVAPKRPRNVDPVVLGGAKGAQCRPFLKVEKDPEKFASCNLLADEIGEVNTPKKAYRIIGEGIGAEVNEVFGVLMLDLHLRFKGFAETGRGEPSSVMAPLKPTLQMALIDGAHAVIIFHVHPSGIEAEPSEADKETTAAFVEACAAIELPLLDHIIVGGDAKRRSYFSFAEANLL